MFNLLYLIYLIDLQTYFMIENKVLVLNAETVAGYQEEKNPFLIKEKLFMNEFVTGQDLKVNFSKSNI